MPTFETMLMTEARTVARLSRRCATLRKQLKLAQAELRQAKKMLKKIAGAATQPDPFDQSPPFRTFDETGGT